MPPGCSLQVFGVSAEDTPARAGLLAENSTHAPIYVRGDKVRVVPMRKDSVRADPAADSKQGFEPNVAFETKMATQAEGELHAPTPGSLGLVDLDLGTLPDADAKLERLPSNTPVLRAWGEATGVEQRWRQASEADDASGGMAFQGASYVSNAATVEVGDSDAESKDGSSNPSPSSSLRERGTWSRYPAPTLDDVIATALPMLSAVSSDVSDSARPMLGDAAGAIGSSVATGTSPSSGIISGTAGRHRAGGDGGGTDGDGDGDGDRGTGGDGQDEHKCEENASFRPRACAGAKVAIDENGGGGEGEGEGRREGRGDVEHVEHVERIPSPTWNWTVRVQAAAMPRKARLRLYLEQRSSLPSPGLTLEEARDAMKEWTPEMDKSLLELLGAVGIEPVSRSCCARVCVITVVHMLLHLQLNNVVQNKFRTRFIFLCRRVERAMLRTKHAIRTDSSRKPAIAHMVCPLPLPLLPAIRTAERRSGVGSSRGRVESVVL